MILELRDFILFASLKIFLGSSVVEQVTVNHLVGGSNPSQGAIFKKTEHSFIFPKIIHYEEKKTPDGLDNKEIITHILVKLEQLTLIEINL